MKTLKYFLINLLFVSLALSCSDDGTGSFDIIVNSIQKPANITSVFNVTQDNTGVVTITPNGEGAVSYDVYFGDETTEPVSIKQGENVVHTYKEGVYEVKIVGIGLSGLKTEVVKNLEVSFKAPEIIFPLVPENDAVISKLVHITVNADYAVSYDVYFGDADPDTPVSANIGETIDHQYENAGIYTIRVVVKGAAIATTEYSQEFEVTAIVQPIASAPRPTFKSASDVISIYGDAYTNVDGTNFNPDWGQSSQGSGFADFDLNGDAMLQYINLSYQGIAFADGTTIDASNMEFIHLDVWTADVTDLEVSLINTSGEKPVTKPLTANEWNSIEIPLTDYTDQGLSLADLIQIKLVGTPWAGGSIFVDNIYFYKEPTPASGLEGTWVLAPEAGALKVGPNPGDGSWWSSDAQTVIDRACLFDDKYVFSLDGSFKNELGTDTWLEGWQGGADACGSPVAPHDGSNPATFVYDANAGTIKITGKGAYLGLPKVNNAGELSNPADAPGSITYNVTLADNNNTMNIVIEAGSGVFWSYKLVRHVSPIEGRWKLAPEAGALKVGPNPGDGSWWSSDAQTVIDRACLFDDEYVFSSNGSFSNVLGADTWLEGWQGASADGCGTPVAPHDGSNPATYNYDVTAGTVTLNGTGAYLGLPKVNNAGELSNPADAPGSITYSITLSNNNTSMEVIIEAGSGVFWTYKLVK